MIRTRSRRTLKLFYLHVRFMSIHRRGARYVHVYDLYGEGGTVSRCRCEISLLIAPAKLICSLSLSRISQKYISVPPSSDWTPKTCAEVVVQRATPGSRSGALEICDEVIVLQNIPSVVIVADQYYQDSYDARGFFSPYRGWRCSPTLRPRRYRCCSTRSRC